MERISARGPDADSTATVNSAIVQASIPAGHRLCPECRGAGIVGRRGRNGDPQDEESWDCPTCDPHDGRASLGHVAIADPGFARFRQ